ncbi:BQ2448_6709 [Microbotryum intermedium]|uniref:BQ2448_6709 protein n=1 Tax=Microbotryum intermedium TaxID=269621 RepID=A0A238FLY1_9BASI|nr:BQ2448_6709 [Microbotryum intermedium]
MYPLLTFATMTTMPTMTIKTTMTCSTSLVATSTNFNTPLLTFDDSCPHF